MARTSTRGAVRPRLCRLVGGITGSITSGSSDGLSILVPELIGSSIDGSLWIGASLVMSDAANAADTQRTVAEVDVVAGRIYWEGLRADTTYSNETYELWPAGNTLDRVNAALNRQLTKLRRAVSMELPTIENEYVYSLAAHGWIESVHDVLAVFYRENPNLLRNAGFEVWGAGPASAPTGWVLAGTDGTIVRSTSQAFFGGYAAQLTRAGTNITLTQEIGLLNRQLIGKTVQAGLWCISDVASAIRIGIEESVSTITRSSFHTASGNAEFLTVERTLGATADRLNLIVEVNANDTVTIENGQLIEASSISTALRDRADTAYRRRNILYKKVQSGFAPDIELATPRNRGGQLLVFSAQPLSAVSADSTVIDAPLELLVLATLVEEGLTPRGDFDRGEWGLLLGEYRDSAAMLASRLLQAPPPDAQETTVVRGA